MNLEKARDRDRKANDTVETRKASEISEKQVMFQESKCDLQSKRYLKSDTFEKQMRLGKQAILEKHVIVLEKQEKLWKLEQQLIRWKSK